MILDKNRNQNGKQYLNVDSVAKKNKINEEVDPCVRNGCKIEDYKYVETKITPHGERKSIKIIYECIKCGKRH